MHAGLKYQPYHGYYRKPWLWYGLVYNTPPRRERIKGGWRWASRPPRCPQDHYTPRPPKVERCRGCGRDHCVWCRCYTPWKRTDDTGGGGSVWQKRLAHRTFRRWANRAIDRELGYVADDPDDVPDVSHAFRYFGDWLD